MKALKKLLVAANILSAFLLLLAYLSPSIDPGTLGLPAIAGLFYPVWFLVNIFFTIFWICLKKRFVWISLITLILGWSYHGRFMQFSIDKKSKDQTGNISILQYNMHSLRDIPPTGTGNYKEKVQNISAFIKKEISLLDVYCSVEGAVDMQLGLPHTMKANYANVYMYSKHAMKAKGQLILDSERDNFGIWADIDHPDGTYRVYNVHLKTNKVTKDTENLMDEMSLQERSTWIKVGDVLTKYRLATAIRSRQAKVLKAHANACPHPYIICGDFNDTPQSHAYQILQKNLTDTFKSRGKGIGTTYAGSLPALRIDYILVSSQLTPISHDILEWPYSDHYPLYCQLKK